MSTSALNPRGRFQRQIWNDWAGRAGLLILALIGLVSWGSLFFWPMPSAIDAGLAAGAWQHPLGTDRLGRDLLLEVLHGLGGALWASLLAALSAVLLGLFLGLAPVLFGRPLDGLIAASGSAVRGLSAPFLPLLILLSLPQHEAFPVLIFAGLAWPMVAQDLRQSAQQRWLSHGAFASRALGRSAWGVCLRYLFYPGLLEGLGRLPRLMALALMTFACFDALGLFSSLRLSGLGMALWPGLMGGSLSADESDLMQLATWFGLLASLTGLALVELSLLRHRASHRRPPSVLPLERLELDLEPGRVVTVLGDESCGKTSLALAATGLLDSNWDGIDQAQRVQQLAHRVTWQGEDLLSVTPERHTSLRGTTVRLLIQDAHAWLPQAASVTELLDKLQLQSGSGESLRDDLGLGLTQTELAGLPAALGRSQRQLLALAVLLKDFNGLLILDEPMAVLNPLERRRAEAVLREAADRGLGLLVLSRDPELPRQLGGHVVLIKEGRVEEEGPADLHLHQTDSPLAKCLRPEIQPMVSAAGQRNVFLDVRLLTIASPPLVWRMRSTTGRAVQSANFVASRAETLAVLGGEGSGRQELAWVLTALDRRGLSGQIRFESQDLLKLTSAQLRLERPRIQLVMADAYAAFAGHRTMLDGLSEGLAIVFPQLSLAERLSRCREMLRLLGLSDEILQAYPKDLSARDLQILAFGRAALVEPLVVVLIDPSRDLGLDSEEAFFEAVVRVQREMGIAVVLSTGDFRLTRRVAHRVILMRQGSIVEWGPVDHVFGQPRQEASQILLDAAFPDQRLSADRSLS